MPQDDAEKHCPNAHPVQGRVQACLTMHRAKLTITCQEELFRSDVNNADDIRLQPKLFRDCHADKKKVCCYVLVVGLSKHCRTSTYMQACRQVQSC